LIHETGTALLDSRLASTSELDEAATQVRAINKVKHGAVYYFVLKTRVLTISFILQLAVQAAARVHQRDILLFCP
jgi:hypothetical protein